MLYVYKVDENNETNNINRWSLLLLSMWYRSLVSIVRGEHIEKRCTPWNTIPLWGPIPIVVFRAISTTAVAKFRTILLDLFGRHWSFVEINSLEQWIFRSKPAIPRCFLQDELIRTGTIDSWPWSTTFCIGLIFGRWRIVGTFEHPWGVVGRVFGISYRNAHLGNFIANWSSDADDVGIMRWTMDDGRERFWTWNSSIFAVSVVV